MKNKKTIIVVVLVILIIILLSRCSTDNKENGEVVSEESTNIEEPKDVEKPEDTEKDEEEGEDNIVGTFEIDPDHPLNSGKEILYYLFNGGEEKLEELIADVSLTDEQVEKMEKIASEKHEKIQDIMDLEAEEFNKKLEEITSEENEKLKSLFSEEEQFEDFKNWISDWWKNETSEVASGEKPEEDTETEGKEFSDIPEDAYYKDALDWAVKNNITADIEGEEFKPEEKATRGEVVTFLWRAYGMEEPTISESPFEDIEEDEYYYKAILWAVENDIAAGMSETEFAPDENVTRGQAATFLWRAAGEKEGASHDFADIEDGAYYEVPVAWAVENEIATGITETEFAPDENVTRSEIITFLYRQFKE